MSIRKAGQPYKQYYSRKQDRSLADVAAFSVIVISHTCGHDLLPKQVHWQQESAIARHCEWLDLL